MPGTGDHHASGANPTLFRERLSVPLSWWLIATVGVAIGGAEVFAGFDWHLIVLVYVGLALPTAAILLATGRLTITVDSAGLHAAGRTLPAESISEVRHLSRAETRRMLGPASDRTAHMAARGYVRESVAVRTRDIPDCPYWLVSTRRPDDLVKALTGVTQR